MTEGAYDIGMVGLGVMGRNLVLNMADKGFSVAGYDLDLTKVEALKAQAGERVITTAAELKELVLFLRIPRALIFLVPAGDPIDRLIEQLLPFLDSGDLIIDGGNSFFKDTDRREVMLAGKGIIYMGVGISGGERGARTGPAIMAGGARDGYERIRPVLEAVAARVEDAPCAAWLGPHSAGHYVKMIHNGIEYGLLQLIAESYDLLKRGLGLSNDRLHAIFARWNGEELNSYLMEITTRIFCEVDDRSDRRLIDVILDRARQKGTGKWASQEAMELQVPVPSFDAALAMRSLSIFKDEREKASAVFRRMTPQLTGGRTDFIDRLKNALYVSMMITYAQGMGQLQRASETYGYGFDLYRIATVWMGGCIIRSAMLNSISRAYQLDRDLPNLLLDPTISAEVLARQEDLRSVVNEAVALGIPAAGFMACLAYFDGLRSRRLPANLIQAQRDYFGSHTYERIDEKGSFHTEWKER